MWIHVLYEPLCLIFSQLFVYYFERSGFFGVTKNHSNSSDKYHIKFHGYINKPVLKTYETTLQQLSIIKTVRRKIIKIVINFYEFASNKQIIWEHKVSW